MEALTLANENQRIFAVVHDMGNESPVVVMFHGFTGNHIESHFLFARLSKELEKKGISSVRFDFRGSGDSDGTFEEMTLSSEISDAKTVVEYARKRFGGNLGILGLSMGGTVALMTAPELNPKALCLWAPASKNKEVFSQGGMPKPEGQKLIDVGGLNVSTEFAKEVLTFDAFSNAKNYAGPSVIIHGTADPTVPFEHSKDLVKEFENAKLIPVEGADHVFSAVSWASQAIEESALFFAENLKE